MRRLVTFLVAAMMASFPSSFLLLLIGPLIISRGGISCSAPAKSSAHQCSIHGGGSVILGGVAATSAVMASPPSRAMASTAATVATATAVMLGGNLWGAPVVEAKMLSELLYELDTDDRPRLKVEVLEQGGSPHCAFSLVEFTNTHPTDDCIIYSTYIAPTVVFPLQENHMKPHAPPSSPIFNVEFPPERALHIHPRSSVVVPVSVFPRWRKPYEDVPHRSHHPPDDSADTTTITSNNNVIHGILDGVASFLQTNNRSASYDDAILVDTLDIIQHAPPSETHDEAILSKNQIHETIIANTSWGFFQMKVPTVCSPPSKEYEYGLPNNLIFLDGGGGWYARRNTTPTAELALLFGDTTIMPAKDSSDPFVYNLYMNNPSENEIRILEVFTTMPDLVGLEMRCNKTFDASVYYPLIGSRILPGRNNIYVGTVRLFPENFHSNMLSSMKDLGFLVIRTNIGLFATAMDFIPNCAGRDYVLGVSPDYTTLEDIHLIRDHIVNSSLKNIFSSNDDWISSPPLSIVKSYRLPALNSESRLYLMSKLSQNKRIPYRKEYVHDTPILKVEPDKIDFGVITPGSQVLMAPLQIANPTTEEIRIVRMSVVMKIGMGEGANTEFANESPQLEIGLGYADSPIDWGFTTLSKNVTTGREDLTFAYEVMIPRKEVIQNAFNIWCKFSTTPEERILTRTYEGSVIFWVTHLKETSYENWEDDFVRFGEDSEGANYATKVDFRGSILPGFIGIRPEFLMFPTHSSMLPAMQKQSKIKSVVGKNQEYYDRYLEVINNFPIPISITGMHLQEPVNDFCRSRFSMPTFGRDLSGDWPTAGEGETWKGLTIRYHLQSLDDVNFRLYPRRCILALETDKVGSQSLPLLIYSGNLIGEIEQPGNSPVTPACFEDGDKSGFSCVNEWMDTTSEGKVLRGALLDMHRGRVSWPRSCSSKNSAESYFRSLLSGSYTINFLKPVIVPFGPVSAGSFVSRSFFLTNLNPFPVEVASTTSVIGNMSVTIGHIPNYVSDMLNEVKGNDDLKYLLQQSRFAQDFFSKLQQKVDISLSDRAKGGELELWFHRQRLIQVAKNVTLVANISEEQEMPCSFGFVLSTDGSFEESINTKQSSSRKISIPAGGVARFEIATRIPKRSRLKNDVTPFVSTGLMLETNYGQAMPIVITYRALSGQLELKPSINVESGSYCGLRFEDANRNCSVPCASSSSMECTGGMRCWAHTACDSNEDDTDEPKPVMPLFDHNNSIPSVQGDPLTIEIPITLGDLDNMALPSNCGISLSIASTFSHDILLSEVQSCNRWFTVFIPGINGTQGKSSSQFLPIKGRNENKTSDESPSLNSVGIYSALTCSHPSKDNSFYACALEWLEKRDLIQPSGCGLPELSTITSFETNINSVKNNAITAIRDVVTFLSVRYASNSSMLGSDGDGEYMKWPRVKMFDAARSAWDEIVSLGLNIVTGDISAKTVYVSSESNSETTSVDKTQSKEVVIDETNTPLTIPMPSVLLRSTLDVPKLFVGSAKDPDVLEFDTVHVGETTTLNVPIRNPTGMTIRVRLTAAEISDGNGEDDTSKVFLQTTADERHPWWTGGSYWMSDNTGNIISATHNVTIKSGAGAFVSLLNPALHTLSAFVLGCGKRCAQSNEVDSTVEEKLYSAIGAASGDGSELFGQPYDKSSLEQTMKSTPHQVLSLSDPPPFSLGRSSLNEIVIPPYGAGTLGPVTFRPSSRRDFSGSFYIENSLTGSEKVKLRGSGGWESLVFLDNDATPDEGGDVEYRFGQSALVFSGTSSTDRSSVVKSFVLFNQGDFPVKIDSVSMGSSEIKKFTHKRRHPSLSFRPDGLFSFWSEWQRSPKCSLRGFSLIGCKDESPYAFWNTTNSLFNLFRINGKFSHEQDQHFEESFELQPNENRTFYIEHRPDCSFMTSYASVIFEVDSKRSRHKAFRSENVQLIVGFDMNGYQLSRCIPYSSPGARFWTKTASVTLPSLMRDVLSLGLTRFTDAEGNPKIPNRHIQVSYLTAAIILVLFLMALDLLYWSDFPPKGADTCSSWNATCRCLARADPVSSDLIAIGKEQTKHVLLSRYRKEGVLSSHCVMSDGSFRRDKGVNAGVHNTFSDSIFKQHKMAQDAKMESNEAPIVLPGGLCWRTAFSRRIGRSDIPRTSSMMSRTRELYAKHQAKLQKTQKIAADSAPPPLAAEQDSTTPLNGNSAIVKPKNVQVAPQPQNDVDDLTDWVQASSSVNGKKTKSKSDQQTMLLTSASKGNDKAALSTQGRKTFTDQIQKVENAKPKMFDNADVRDLTVNTPVETKVTKQRQRVEVKMTKKNRVNNQQELAKEELLPTKRRVADTKNIKWETNAPGDLSVAKVKQGRLNRKENDGIKVSEHSKPKEGNQKTKAAKNVRQPVGDAKAKAHDAPNHATNEDFPPLSAAANISAPANIRPPPGLFAPPGFSDQPGLTKAFPQSYSPQSSPVISSPARSLSPNAGLSLAESSSFHMPASVAALPFQNDRFSLASPPADSSPMIRNDDITSFLNMRQSSFTPPLMQESHSKEDVNDLLGSSNYFNVSNFLDGIFSDEPPVANREALDSHVRTDSNPFQAVAAVPLDPWKNSTVDDPLATLLGNTPTDSSVIAGIPLNSGAPSLFGTTIQSNTVSAELAYASLVSDDGEKDNDTFLEPDSFYNQLLGEE